MKAGKEFSSEIYYCSPGRGDRSGAQIHDMLFAKAYCIENNYKYIGCPIHSGETKTLVEYLNITNNYKIKDGSTYKIILPNVYRKKDSIIFTQKIRDKIISNFNYKYDNNFTITVHIRRGDVGPEQKKRYLYNKYYINILKQILIHLEKYNNKNIVINICSESKSFESFDEFEQITDYNVKLYLDTSLNKVYDLMIHSDILILSKSSFSFVPAFYNKRCVIYYPFWHNKLDHWLNSTEIDFDVELEKQIKNLIVKYHS